MSEKKKIRFIFYIHNHIEFTFKYLQDHCVQSLSWMKIDKLSHFFLLRHYVMYVLHIGIGTYYIYLGRRFTKVKYIASLLKKLKQPSSYIVPSHFFKIIATFVPAFFPHTTHCQKKWTDFLLWHLLTCHNRWWFTIW